jgi:hypothetical protein
MDAAAMCPDTTVIELTARLLTSCSRTERRSPIRVLTVKELIDAMSNWDTRARRELTSIVLAI